MDIAERISLIIKEKNLRCYCHSSLAMNLGNPGWDTYVGDLLSYASAHSFNGVVFHCGKALLFTFG